MIVRVLHFDVFARTPGKGNPAGIVLSAENLDEHAMQAIAQNTGFGDTAFVVPSRVADFGIRYFSPRREVALCGHATIAASIALHSHAVRARSMSLGRFSLETRAGVLPIDVDQGARGELMVSMSQAPAELRKFAGNRDLLLHSLGVSAGDLHPSLPLMYGSTGRWTLVVPVQGLDAMRRMRPRPEEFAFALVDMPEASVHPFCLETVGQGVDMHARHFSAPSSGTVEDPVTGTASGVLGAYYREFVDGVWDDTSPLLVEQGLEIGRDGQVHVWAVKTATGYAVRIAGTACFVEERTLNVRKGFGETANDGSSR